MAEAPPFEAKYNTDFDKTLLKRPRVLDYTDEEWYELLDGSALDKFDFGDLLTTLIYYDDGIESARTFSELSTETFDYRPAKDYDKDGHYHPIVVNRVGVSVLVSRIVGMLNLHLLTCGSWISSSDPDFAKTPGVRTFALTTTQLTSRSGGISRPMIKSGMFGLGYGALMGVRCHSTKGRFACSPRRLLLTA